MWSYRITLATALLLSCIAAYYSVIGLTSIFTGAFWSIVLMGSSLELGKVVAISWVYRNWKTASKVIKYYLVTAIAVLMMITSMGTFGYLSKAHTTSTSDNNAAALKLKVVEQQEAMQQQRLQFLIAQTNKVTGINKGIDRQIQQVTEKLEAISKEKAVLLQAKNTLDAEVGPLKFIADMIYGESDTSQTERAVRLVIILLVLVFDPLAVVLLIAANTAIPQKKYYYQKKNTSMTKKVKELIRKPLRRKTVEINKDSIVRMS